MNFCNLDFDIVSTVRCPVADFDIRISSLCYIDSTNYFVRNYQRIMQNKPNFQKAQMNVSLYNTTNYKYFNPLAGYKNKPNSNPIKPNLKRAKMNINSIITKDYRKKDDFTVRINKPNSNPISSKPKMNVTLYDIEDYENKTTLRPKKTNPSKANFKRLRLLIDPMLPLNKLSNVQYYSRYNFKVKFPKISIIRAYPNNRLVMRPSEKFEAKAAGQKCSEAWFSPR